MWNRHHHAHPDGLSAPPRPCSVGNCRRLATNRGRCSHHERPSARARGFNARWDALAKQWLERRPWCGQQHDGRFDGTYSRCARTRRRTPATCVNHRLSPRQGGSWFDVRNLESVCASCNQKHVRDTGLTDVRYMEITTRPREDWG